jgi:hypothetical protein
MLIFQDVLWETAKGSGSESTSTLEEVTEDMEKEMQEDDEDDDEADEDEQLIRLFMVEEGRRREKRKRRTAAAAAVQEQHHHKELFALCRRHGCRRIAHARKHHTRTDNQEVQKAAKLHRQLAAVQRRRRRRQAADKKRVSVSDIFQDAIAMKMFMSVLDPEDILEDWNWNLDEKQKTPSAVEEAEGWETNMPKDDDNSTAIKQRYYDIPSVKDEFNDFNFWRTEAELVNLLPVEEDAWPLWEEWGSADEILANTLEVELLPEELLPEEPEVESGEQVDQECPPPWTGRQEEFRLPMTRMPAARGSSRCRHLDEDDDHWSLWTEWGSVDEILDNTLVAGLADLDDDAASPEEHCHPEKDEDVDSGFLGETEEDWGKWTMTATTMAERQSFWQDSYDNESILHSLVNDEMMEEAGGASGGGLVSYWDESRRDNHLILEALLHEEPPIVAGGRTAARRKRKFREEKKDTDEDIVFEEDQEKETDTQPTFSGYEDGSGDQGGGGHHQTHQFWEAFSKNKNNNNNNNAMFEESRADSEERDLCSCESGVFWLSSEDNRRIAENLVEEPAAAFWEASLENSKIARALVGEVVGDSGATAKGEKRPRKEAEDYFKDWRRNLISPRKSR